MPTSPALFTTKHFAVVAARWPESIVYWDQGNQVALMSSLALLMLLVADIATDRRWRLMIAIGLVISGLLVAGVAFAQSFAQVKTIYGEAGRPISTNFAGPFYHHTSAGAYINAIWPIGLGLAALAWQSGKAWRFPVTLLMLLLTAIILAAHGLHVSRMPQVVGLFLVGVLVWLLVRSGSFRRGVVLLSAHKTRAAFAAATVLVVLVGLIAATGKLKHIASRWQLWAPQTSVVTRTELPPESAWPKLMRADLFIPSPNSGTGMLGARSIGYDAAFAAISARPIWGHGPANWMGAASQHSKDPLVRTFFQFLQFTHNDFLQVAVEWGVVAAIGWAGLLVGGAGSVVYIAFRHRRADPLVLAAAIGATAVLLQSLWDFPLQMGAIVLTVSTLSGLCWASLSAEKRAALA
ncbi:MAG: O-antigen ligase family protein [Verrucomicrobiota bacterium]